MKAISAAVFSALFCTVLSASLKVKEEHRTAFFGEDVHIDVLSENFDEVVFKSRSKPSSEVVLLGAGQAVNPRGKLNQLGHLVLEDVQEEDEGVYVIKNNSNPADVKHFILIVRDCALEQVVKYGDTYNIPLNNIQGPITLEFRPSLAQSNETDMHQATEPPAVVLYSQAAVSAEEYLGRLSVSEKRVTLRAVRMADEGSFTVLDRDGKVRKRNCLNVREHQNFVLLPYGETLKINLYLHHSKVSVVYTPNSDNRERVIVDQGVLAVPLDPLLEGRLTVVGSELIMKKVRMTDMGVFKVTDLAGFPVSINYIEVEGLSASLKVKEEHRTAFFGEDVHIDVPSENFGEVVFKSRSKPSSEVVLLQAGRAVNPRGKLNQLGHLVLEDVQEEDEGVYVIKNNSNPADLKHFILIVRDCALEQVVKYGDTYNIPLNNIQGPITLEFRSSLAQPNETDMHQATEPPAVVLYSQAAVSAEEYLGRLSVSEKRVTLHAVRMADEGSFTVLDRDGKVRKRNCLNVREHQNFLRLAYGETLKINLYMHYSKVSVIYTANSDNRERVIVDQGVLVVPLDPLLEGRLTVVGSELIMKKVRMTDIGVFKVTDLAGFPVSINYIEVEAYKLSTLNVAILSMLGLIAFLLLVCLLSCLYKVHRRNEKNKKLILIAQQAGKGDGEAFRQVVHDAYTRFTEESQMQSTWDNPTESTEVTIKGLEVSKPGRYQALTSDKNFLEMSDSGVEFTSSGLPLDSDTDVPTYASLKPLLNASSPMAETEGVLSDSQEATVVPDGDFSASRTPDSAMSASPASNPRSVAAATPDGSLRGAASPGAASRGTAGSDPAQTPEAGADGGEAEAGQKDQST